MVHYYQDNINTSHKLNYLGRHCCLYCTIPKDEMKKPLHERNKYPPRDLLSLSNDFKKFTLMGSNIKYAKECNNVIDQYMFNIPIDQVYSSMVLGVHILLKSCFLLKSLFSKMDIPEVDKFLIHAKYFGFSFSRKINPREIHF